MKLKPAALVQDEPPQSSAGTTLGRGKLLGLLKPQAQPTVAKEEPPAPCEISSTAEALTQLRIKRKEEASGSSGSKAPKVRTLQELEAEAAPFEEAAEEVIPEKRGTAGMDFQFSLYSFDS